MVAAAPLALKTDQPPKIKLPVVKSDRFCEVCGNGLVKLAPDTYLNCPCEWPETDDENDT